MFGSRIASMQSKSQSFISSSHLSIVSVENWMFVEAVHYYLLHMCNSHHYHLEALQIELSLDSHVHHKLLSILLKNHLIRFNFTCWTFFQNICHFTYITHYLYTLESISVMSSLSKLFPRMIRHAWFYQLHQQHRDPFYFGATYRRET